MIGRVAYDVEGRTECLGGDFSAAERSETRPGADRKGAGINNSGEHRRHDEILTRLATSQARQGYAQQAGQAIAPVIKYDAIWQCKIRATAGCPKSLRLRRGP